MGSTASPIEPARIALYLGGSTPRTLQALTVARRLAAALDRELQCTFVEDIELIHAAELPFTRELGALSLAPRALRTEDILRALRQEAINVERLIAAAVRESAIRWTFRIDRGRLLHRARELALPDDWIVIGTHGLGLASALPRQPTAAQNEVLVVLPEGRAPLDLLVAAGRVAPEGSTIRICVLAMADEPATRDESAGGKRSGGDEPSAGDGTSDLPEPSATLSTITALLPRVDQAVGRRCRWTIGERITPPDSLIDALDRLRPSIVVLPRGTVEPALAALNLAMRRLGGTVILPTGLQGG